ncbi:HD-GYP domain-containing protein [Hydrogenophilus thiooxidans]|uniref:HD-GYP domain-containing protein n=1 Tax=Hydrogenophilus thiooxidans TaxID=2820326 RepID=UPI001C24854F|nr:HD domain-containing phosphohydrolase [Hydrogenophilus thiooxidans]
MASVACLVALFVGYVAWHFEIEAQEEATVRLAEEEAQRALGHLVRGVSDIPEKTAQKLADLLTGGLFDIAEIYGPNGKLAESLTPIGEAVEKQLPKHPLPKGSQATYESIHLSNGDSVWILRIFVPLAARQTDSHDAIAFMEGVRVVPAWQRTLIEEQAAFSALTAALAALLCGAVLYPIVVWLARDNEKKKEEVLDSHIAMMESLGRAIAKRDSDTGAHNYRVAWLAAQIAEAMGLQGAAMQSLIAGSFLHDVGKIAIPDAILLKPGKLTSEEMEIMRTHVTEGVEIVQGAGWLEGARDVVGGHHEKWDGSGYPRGLADETIPLAARIFAVADVFDALTSKRPYKEPFSFEKAMSILHEGVGSHFDPEVLSVFQGMAADLYREIANADEAKGKAMLEAVIRKHFACAS